MSLSSPALKTYPLYPLTMASFPPVLSDVNTGSPVLNASSITRPNPSPNDGIINASAC